MKQKMMGKNLNKCQGLTREVFDVEDSDVVVACVVGDTDVQVAVAEDFGGVSDSFEVDLNSVEVGDAFAFEVWIFDAVETVVVELVHSSEVVVQIVAAESSVADLNEFVFVHDVVVDAVVAYQVVALAIVYLDPWLELTLMKPLDIETVVPDFEFLAYP